MVAEGGATTGYWILCGGGGGWGSLADKERSRFAGAFHGWLYFNRITREATNTFARAHEEGPKAI